MYMKVFGKIKAKIRDFAEDNRGVGIVEIILILVVLVALVLIFKTQITRIVQDAFAAITNNSSSIIG